MTDFLRDDRLNAEIAKVLQAAEKVAVIASPYIKLHHRILDVLRRLKQHPEVRLIILFGKSEGNFFNSVKKEDMLILMDMPNVQIKYQERLHAKFYSNERIAILSSMNLYEYSHNNNIEFGIKVSSSSLVETKFEREVRDFMKCVVDEAELIFQADPTYKSSMMGLKRKFTGSEVTINEIDKRLVSRSVVAKKKSRGPKVSRNQYGFCIRTGQKINLNLERPLSDKAYDVWSSYGDYEYPENYCHLTGEPSGGETCYDRPILRKNWDLYMELSDELS